MKFKALLVTCSLLIGSQVQAEDRFESIRQVWPTCASCHGANGEGIGTFPSLIDKDADYIISALLQYKNKEKRGSMSSVMYPQAGMLTEGQIGVIGVYIQEGLPKE
jgi:cytochrome c553